MTPGNRTVGRFSLPVELLDRLDDEAGSRHVTTDDLIYGLLVEHVPTVLAQAMRTHLSGESASRLRNRGAKAGNTIKGARTRHVSHQRRLGPEP
jgi:hypothetical protein